MSHQILQFDLGKENGGRERSDAFSTGQSHIVHYIWSWGLARGAEACTYLYLTLLQSFWNGKGPSRHPASWWKKTSVYMLHTAPLLPNKAYPFRQKTMSLQCPSNQIRSSKGVFPPHFLAVYNGYLDSLFGQRKRVWPGTAVVHFCPAELGSYLVLWCRLLLCRQEAMSQSSRHFRTERVIVRE